MTNKVVGTTASQADDEKNPVSQKSSHGIPDYQETLPRILKVNKGIHKYHLMVNNSTLQSWDKQMPFDGHATQH